MKLAKACPPVLLMIFWMIVTPVARTQTAPAAPPEMVSVNFSGTVVDDETGQPVEMFATQSGSAAPPDYIVQWGGSGSSNGNRPGGRFGGGSGFSASSQRRVGMRILADGYLPQPVTNEPVQGPARLTGLVVRLHRGAQVQGIVVDAQGNAVPGARLYVASDQLLSVPDTLSGIGPRLPFIAGADGRFSLTGIAPGLNQRIVATGPTGMPVALVTNIDPAADMKIQLPPTANLIIRYDIAGADDTAEIQLAMVRPDKPEWRMVSVYHKLSVNNHDQLEIHGLTPGTYDIRRSRLVRLPLLGKSAMLDRDMALKVEAGTTTEISWVRASGHSVKGAVHDIGADLQGAFLFIYQGEVAYDPMDFRSTMNARLCDAQICSSGGKFQTCRLEPGTYTVVAEAYATTRFNSTGVQLPAQIGTAKVIVTADAESPPVEVTLHEYERTRLR